MEGRRRRRRTVARGSREKRQRQRERALFTNEAFSLPRPDERNLKVVLVGSAASVVGSDN